MYQISSQSACAVAFLFSISCSLATAAAESKPVLFATTIDSSSLTGTQEVELNLGDRLCNTELEIEWTISNPLETPIQWPRSTSSCGCISSFPKSLTIGATKQSDQPGSTTVRFKIKVPAKAESVTRQVVFWDDGGTAHLSANVKVNVMPYVRLETRTFSISDDSKTQKTIRLTATSDQIDMQTLKMTASGAELISLNYEPIDRKSGVLDLKLDPKLGSADSIQSELHIEMQLEGVPNSVDLITLHFTHRTTVIPKTPIFVSHGPEYRGNFVIRSAGLIDALADKQILEAFAIEGKGNKVTRVPLVVDTPSPSRALCKLSLSLSTGTNPKGFSPQRLLLKCGKWEHEIPCQFP